MFVVVNWLNIVLVIEAMVKNVVSLVIDLVTVLMLIGRVATLMILINAMSILIWCHIAVIRVAVTVESIIVFSIVVRVSIWAVEGAMDSVLMEMNGFDIMLIIESVVQSMMSLVVNLVAVLVLISRVATLMVLINAMSILIWCHIAVIRIAVTVESIIVFSIVVRVSIWAVEGAIDSVFMEVNWLNIVLIVESVIQSVVSLVIDLVAVLVLIGRVATFMVLSIAMCMLIWCHIAVI